MSTVRRVVKKGTPEVMLMDAKKATNLKTYIAIDLKSFYASVECVERGLDPLTTNLVVADESRTEKTICLAVSPSLKSYGVPGRPRLFEVIRRVKLVNAQRAQKSPGRKLRGSSYDDLQLKKDPSLGVDYIVAPPRMAHYMQYSVQIYKIYLRFIAPEDIHVYSIDEVFIDVTHYLKFYRMTAHELAVTMIREVLKETGITATAGIGSNLYLCKVAMDIVAKHMPADKDGVRIAELDERSYREKLWSHQPLTDFWRIGKGYARKLHEKGLYTMGDIARCSLGGKKDFYNEDLLFGLFGIHAELLIDHAWGIEPTEISDIKAYQPASKSISSGQVLKCGYTYADTKAVVTEMADALALDLIARGKRTNQLVLDLHYDRDNMKNPEVTAYYDGKIEKDFYGREVPAHAHGTYNFEDYTASVSEITAALLELYDRIIDRHLLVRRLYLSANRIIDEDEGIRRNRERMAAPKQIGFFTDLQAEEEASVQKEAKRQKEQNLQKAILDIKGRYGKNAVVKGMNMTEKATGMERNNSIGGHRA